MSRKCEAWKQITGHYNNVAITGKRTTGQLKVLYENLKRKTKKDVADKNVSYNFLAVFMIMKNMIYCNPVSPKF